MKLILCCLLLFALSGAEEARNEPDCELLRQRYEITLEAVEGTGARGQLKVNKLASDLNFYCNDEPIAAPVIDDTSVIAKLEQGIASVIEDPSIPLKLQKFALDTMEKLKH